MQSSALDELPSLARWVCAIVVVVPLLRGALSYDSMGGISGWSIPQRMDLGEAGELEEQEPDMHLEIRRSDSHLVVSNLGALKTSLKFWAIGPWSKAQPSPCRRASTKAGCNYHG